MEHVPQTVFGGNLKGSGLTNCQTKALVPPPQEPPVRNLCHEKSWGDPWDHNKPKKKVNARQGSPETRLLGKITHGKPQKKANQGGRPGGFVNTSKSCGFGPKCLCVVTVSMFPKLELFCSLLGGNFWPLGCTFSTPPPGSSMFPWLSRAKKRGERRLSSINFVKGGCNGCNP